MEILGCRLDPIDADAATESILRFAREGRSSQVVTLGTEMVVYAQRDARYRAILNQCALSLCDTFGLLSVARIRGAKLKRRVTGVELVERLCARAGSENVPAYFLGSAPGVAQAAASALKERFPDLPVAGIRDGYFSEAESAAVAAEIRDSGAKLLFVGMGFPRQEFWLADFLVQTGCGTGIGVGGSFDVLGGKVQRAPEEWRRFGLEWLYRLIKEPHRWRRQMALPYFVLLVARESLRSSFVRGKA